MNKSLFDGISSVMDKFTAGHIVVTYNWKSWVLNDYSSTVKYFNSLGAYTYDDYYIGATGNVIYAKPTGVKKELPAKLPVFTKLDPDCSQITTNRMNVKVEYIDGEIIVKFNSASYDNFIKIHGFCTLNESDFYRLMTVLSENFKDHKIHFPYSFLNADEKKMVGNLTISKYFSLTNNYNRLYESSPVSCYINDESIIMEY